MHGVIFVQLNKMIREKFGDEVLEQIHKDAGTDDTLFVITRTFPDDILEAILTSATKQLNASRDELLETFGEFLAPQLLQIYGAFIKEKWTALDLLEHTETTIHRTVKMRDDKMQPPALKVKRVHKNKVTIMYESKRQMLYLGIGIIRHIGKHYEEELDLEIQDAGEGKMVVVTKRKQATKNYASFVSNVVSKFFS